MIMNSQQIMIHSLTSIATIAQFSSMSHQI